ncbi:MAG: GNAT family protein [bacterium]|nr:GNAT family protein [bacterium]
MIFEKGGKMYHWKGKHIIIASSRLLLMPLEESDAEEVLGWINNPDIVKNFQFFTGTVCLSDEMDYIKKMRNSPSDLLLGIIVDGEELIGMCGIHEIDFHNHTARLGVIIGRKDHWNQGYAKEAIIDLLSWAFCVMHLNKVYLNVFTTNERGIKLYTEVGFQVEAPRLREEYRINGEYVDMMRMAVLRKEWNNGKAS